MKIEYIKKCYTIGDVVRVSCDFGIREGRIEDFGDDNIILRPFEEGRKPIFVSEEHLNGIEELIEDSSGKSNSDTNILSEVDNSASSSQLSSIAATNTSGYDKGSLEVKLTDSQKATSGDKEQSLNSTERPSEGPTNSTPGFKVIDRIPLDELYARDPALKKKNEKSKKKESKKPQTIGNSFEALSFLVSNDHKKENQRVVPACGEIRALIIDRAFGFIKDAKSSKDIFFLFSNIIEDNLRNNLRNNTPVVYSVSENEKGFVAIGIHKPGKIEDLLKLSQKLLEGGEFKNCLSVINHILTEYPNNYSADKMRIEVKKHIPTFTHLSKDLGLYAQAKKCQNDKEYDKAIELYLKCIDKGIKKESAIKDLGMLYVQLSKSEDVDREDIRLRAVNFMNKYVHYLPTITSTYFYLENFYYSVKDFENFFKIISQLLDDESILRDKNRHSTYLLKKAAALIQVGNKEAALNAIDEALEILPNNPGAIKLKDIIENPMEGESLEEIISATKFDTWTSGFSPFIENTLNEYQEYFGVPPKVMESGDFTEETLNGIKSLVSKAGRSRPKERARYLLTEGKLIRDIDPERVMELRSVMARYCNAMALNHISDNSPMDVVRFYYNEAFSLEEKYDATSQQVSYYLLSLCLNYTELLNATSQNISVDTALNKIANGGLDLKKWENVLSMLLYNREISAQIISKLYRNKNLKDESFKALKFFGINNIDEINTQENFASVWNAARDKRLGDIRKLIIAINALGENISLEEIGTRLYELRDYRYEWVCALDLSRFNNIINNIVPAIDLYIKSSGFRNKESNYNNANAQLCQLIEEISNLPSKLSYEAILPLMSKVKVQLKDSFNDVVKMSEPRIKIILLSSETVIHEDNIVSIQVEVSNHKDSSPIKNVCVEVIPDHDINFLKESINNTLYNAIEGGEESIFKLKIQVSQKIITNKATSINIICKYSNGGKEKSSQVQLSLKLYSSDEYRPINNPYAPVADGGPVPVDSNMFFGRDEFISNVAKSIIESEAKQVIIYGQKRCGKSSVLIHLKSKLQGTGKAFCVFFSLGDIIQNLSESSFYHKILSAIQDELDDMSFRGFTDLPQVNFPSATSFRNEDTDNPLNTFIKYMTLFKRACLKIPGWENKKLVVMIDEFTYLYTEIKKNVISNSIMKQWKAVTQNERAKFSVVLVGQDVVPSFKKEDYARNAFGVIQDIRLTYLSDAPARELIEKPILDENGNTRYIGNAVSRIIDYTSRNPYYIQIFCARLVDYMNSNKSIMVTEADVNEVAKSFVNGDQALEEDKFDNLIRAGETEDFQEYPEEEILAILRQISINSKNIGYCSIDDIDVLSNREREKQILKHLVDREVLEQKGDNNYKIQVKLFQEWLLNH
jgi:cold shock CspA family protein